LSRKGCVIEGIVREGVFNAVCHELRSPGEHENVAGVGAKAFVAILQQPRADRAKFVSISSAIAPHRPYFQGRDAERRSDENGKAT